jgi:hypothetical protein
MFIFIWVVYISGMFKQPEDPLDHGRSILGASQKEHLVSAELGSATSSPNTLSLAIVEAPELDTSTPSAGSNQTLIHNNIIDNYVISKNIILLSLQNALLW